MKPTLNLYLGHRVKAITRGGQSWEWGIKFRNGVEIRNKSRRETFKPIGIVGAELESISMSMLDTTLHFRVAETLRIIKVSLNPTQYVIFDPRYGGEVFPQWPEELEEAGITSHPDEEASAEPSEEWSKEEQRLNEEQQRRHSEQARNFLQGEHE